MILRRALGLALSVCTLLGILSGAAPAEATSGGPAVACPAPEGNARYVRFIYLEILDRCPDASGGAYWTRRLDAGLAPARFAETVDLSLENLGANNVDPLYRHYLGRMPTAAERTRGIDSIRAERGNARLTAELLASDEGYQHVTAAPERASTIEQDQAWLEVAYNRIIDRASDPDGRAYYSRRFSPGGSTVAERFSVAMSLERSTSNARSWVLATMTEALGRTPDAGGRDFWISWLMGRGRWQTFRMWTLQLGSSEAYRRSQTQPS